MQRYETFCSLPTVFVKYSVFLFYISEFARLFGLFWYYFDYIYLQIGWESSITN